MLRWYPSVLLRVVLALTYVPVAFFSIFVVMVLVERDTPWGIGTWRGPGATADFWKIAALLALGWTLLTLGWRGAGALFKWGIVSWHLGLAAGSLFFALRGESPVVHGEAIGFRLSLGILAPAYSLTVLTCTLIWIVRDARRGARRSVSPLRRRNLLAAGCAVLGLSVSVLAFAHELTELGTIACLAATFALQEVMRPLNPSAELHRALVAEGSAHE